jgi:hypothetical protein
MKLEGGCYCRKLRYVAEGEPTLRAQCHCRECQYISGGSPNMRHCSRATRQGGSRSTSPSCLSYCAGRGRLAG